MTDVVDDSEIPDLLADFKYNYKEIIDDSNWSILEQPAPALCADRIDYTLRDMYEYGEMGLNEDFTVHSFRHTFSINCLKAGMKLHYLTQILGHEDPKTTKIYTTLLPHDLRDEVMKFFPFPLEKLLNDII